MKRLNISTAFAVLMIMLVAGAVSANGAYTPPVAGAGPAVTAAPVWNECQLVQLTVAQAWLLSGQDYATFTRMVGDTAGLVMANRSITLPDSAAAGAELGRMIRQRAEADPNQLLYVIVDSSIREYMARHTES